MAAESYARGATEPALIEQTIGDFFDAMVARQTDALALVSLHEGQRFSYRDLQAESHRLASALLTTGRVPGYRVGGKTGTAKKIEGGRYVKKYVSSFVGLAPMSDPRLIVAVMIDEPGSGQHYGGDVAGPVFANIMSGSLRTLGVPQDSPIQVAQHARTVAQVAKEKL